MKEWFFEILRKTELHHKFLSHFGDSKTEDSCLAKNDFDEGWYFTEDSIQYRQEDLFDCHEEGYNWVFSDSGFEWVLKQVLFSHGFEVEFEGGDEEDRLFVMKKVIADKKVSDHFYRVHCTNEDGRDETLGYFFDKEKAEIEARKAENEPRNKKYMITYHLEELNSD